MSKRINLTLSEEEYEVLKKLADKEFLPLAPYIKSTVLKATQKVA